MSGSHAEAPACAKFQVVAGKWASCTWESPWWQVVCHYSSPSFIKGDREQVTEEGSDTAPYCFSPKNRRLQSLSSLYPSYISSQSLDKALLSMANSCQRASWNRRVRDTSVFYAIGHSDQSKSRVLCPPISRSRPFPLCSQSPQSGQRKLTLKWLGGPSKTSVDRWHWTSSRGCIIRENHY